MKPPTVVQLFMHWSITPTMIPATTECALHSVDKLSPLGEQIHRDDPRDHQNCRLRDRAIPSPLHSLQTITILFVSHRIRPDFGSGVEGIFDVQRHQEAHRLREVVSPLGALGCPHYLLDSINGGPAFPKAIQKARSGRLLL